MTPARFARLKEVVLTAAHLPDGRRDAYLRSSCEDDAMRREAEALLRHRDATPDLPAAGHLESVLRTLAEGAGHAGAGGRLPDSIGHYRILGVLGEGGMGVVYHALQTDPIEREVALKVIRGVDESPAMLARLEAEGRALARLQHPGIATVLDAGSDGDGRPFVVMELVRGVPITDYCRAGSLEPRERARLLYAVCRAVAHAHRRGIVHRDLKPSNVLVTLVGGEPAPKVIDFSIAKVLDADGADSRTRTGQIVGTLEYMSPEQARGEVASIDTRSDVYSLGALAYELLSGRLPHDVRRLPLHEAVAHIADDHAESLAGTTTGAGATARVDVDLATIVAKCLEKERSRRYADADAVADDLARYLESRPIAARRPSAAYRLRMLARRHRVAFGSAVALLALLVGFSATVSYQLGVQTRERRRAEAALARADRINDFLTSMLSSADPTNLGVETTLRESLDWAARAASLDLGDDPAVQGEILHTIGTAHVALGEYGTALEHLERALAARRAAPDAGDVDVAATLIEMSAAARLSGDVDTAAERARTALETLRGHPDEQVTMAASLDALALAELARGEPAAARRDAEEALELRRAALGSGHESTGHSLVTLSKVLIEVEDPESALEAYDHGVEILRAALGPDHPRYLETVAGEHAVVLYQRRDRRLEGFEALSQILDRVIPLYGADHPLVATIRRHTAELLMETGVDLPLAERRVEEALAVLRSRLGPRHESLGHALNDLGYCRHALGDVAGAETAYREAIDVLSSSSAPLSEFPFMNLSILLIQQGRLDEAAALIDEGARRQQRHSPGKPGFSLFARAILLSERGDDDAVELVRSFVADPFDAEAFGARMTRNILGRLLARDGDPEAGEALLAAERPYLLRTTLHAGWIRHELRRTAEHYLAAGRPRLAQQYLDAIDRLEQAIRRPFDETLGS